MYLGRPRHVLSLRHLLGQVLQGSGSIGDLGFMNPTRAPELLWDFCEAVKGLFIDISHDIFKSQGLVFLA